MNKVRAEISNCKRIIKEHPNIGTVLDSLKFATQEVLECIEKKINNIKYYR